VVGLAGLWPDRNGDVVGYQEEGMKCQISWGGDVVDGRSEMVTYATRDNLNRSRGRSNKRLSGN
jgi:hypothetical protein